MNNILKNKQGFTTVELLVAMSLFVVLISIVSGVFVNSLRSHRMAVALIAVNGNASLALEQIAREMRTGKNFSQSGNEISFTNANSEEVAYRLDGTSGKIERGAAGSFKRITADNVRVKNLTFRLFTGSASNVYPPRITIVFQALPANFPAQNPISLQTTVSARSLR